MSELPPAILLMGPTASGKTDLAMALYDRLPVELISVDSALIYRGMDIGTAKPSPQELADYPHRLIDICDPSEAYSAENFRLDALREMRDITREGRIPLLVGGTMLYYRALQHGLSDLPASDPQLRAQLEREVQEKGLAAVHAELAAVDPEAARRIHENDPQRTLRALEVYRQTGRPMSALQASQKGRGMPYKAIKLVRAPADRTVLHERIARRFERMLDAGFEDEVRTLIARGDLHAGMPSMRAVGYRQMWEFIHGNYDYAEMVERGKAATRQLAKRQITWLRSEERACWLDEDAGNVVDQAMKLLENALKVSVG